MYTKTTTKRRGKKSTPLTLQEFQSFEILMNVRNDKEFFESSLERQWGLAKDIKRTRMGYNASTPFTYTTGTGATTGAYVMGTDPISGTSSWQNIDVQL